MILAASDIATPHVYWLAIAPEIALGAAAVLIVLSRALLRRRAAATPVAYALAAAGVITAGAMLFWQWQRIRDDGPMRTMGKGTSAMVGVDGFGVFLGVIIVSATEFPKVVQNLKFKFKFSLL